MLNDYVIRAATLRDLDAIDRLAHMAQMGMTSLPRDRASLQRKLILSHKAFHEPVKSPNGELYLFVLEHLITHEVVGTCKLLSRAGIHDPVISFQIEKNTRTSPSADKTVTSTLLHPKIQFNGPSEIGGLFVDDQHRDKGLGRMVSLSRFLFLAMHRERFASHIMAEMRGVIDSEGQSPFWSALGQQLFHMDFRQADYMAGLGKQFVMDLLPHFPIYTDLLPASARVVIGETHVDTVPALRLLKQEGFLQTDLIDVFDAGPKVIAEVDAIRTVQETRTATISAIVSEVDRILVEGTRPDEPLFLMSNGKLDEFRTCMGNLDVDGAAIKISRAFADALHVKVGDPVWFSPLYPNSFLRRFEQWYSQAVNLSGVSGSKAKGHRFDR
jgi:arginine N-succinyltransferase